MIRNIFLLILSFSFVVVHGQIFPERHTTNAHDAWLSCDPSANPNAIRGTTHWIMYEFASNINIYDLTVWNMNHPDRLKDGLKDVIIDYSTDGANWTTIDTFTFPKANASGFYEGFTGPDLQGVTAKYLLLTPINNHGGACYGLSEIKIYTSDQSNTDLNFDFTACENDGMQQNLTGGLAFGGYYSGIGVVDNNDETFDFNVNKVGPGIHPINYTYGNTVLEGEIKVLPCTDPICNECEECNTADVVHVNAAPIHTDIYNGYRILSSSQTATHSDVTFFTKNSVELNPGFEVSSPSNFLVDFRTCYNNLLTNSGFEGTLDTWHFSQHSTATGSMTLDNSMVYEGNSSVKIDINNTDGTDWHLQLSQPGHSVVAGKKYRLSFAAKGSTDNLPVGIVIQLNEPPWTVYTHQNFILSPYWEVYAYEFEAEDTINGNVSVKAMLASTPNQTIWIDNFKYIQLN